MLNQVYLSLTAVGNLISFNITWLSTACLKDFLTLTFNCFFAIQWGNYYFQLTNHLIWLTYVTMFLTERKKQIRNKIGKTTFANIDLLYFSTFIFEKTRFHWRRQTFRKRCYRWGRTKPFDINDIENLQNLPRFVFIDKECGNLKLVNDDKELTRNINQKKKLDVSQIACWCSLCDKCKRKYFFDNNVAIILWIS